MANKKSETTRIFELRDMKPHELKRLALVEYKCISPLEYMALTLPQVRQRIIEHEVKTRKISAYIYKPRTSKPPSLRQMAQRGFLGGLLRAG